MGDSRRHRRRVRPKSRTLSIKLLSPITRRARLEMVPMPEPERPRTRADCQDGPRPCPWVGCRFNNYLDVNPATGAIKLNFPDLEPWDMPPERSCSLDVSAAGGITLEEAGLVMNLTRERIRQIEIKYLVEMRWKLKDGL